MKDNSLWHKKNMNNLFYYDEAEQLLAAVEEVVKETEIVADIGCGIAPMNYFRPALHFMIEPWHEYSDILSHRYQDDKSTIVLRAGALEALRTFGDNSVDSIFLLDVIEHMEKDEGVDVIKECERVARQQILLFTPLGFMSQEMEIDEKDGWGLSGTVVQTHKSGWIPEDFSEDWAFYICETFHKVDHRNQALEKPHGAFFAVKNMKVKEIAAPKAITNIKRPSKAEIEVEALTIKSQTLQSQLQTLQTQHNLLQNFYVLLHNSYVYMEKDYTSFQKEYVVLQDKFTHLTDIPIIKLCLKLRAYCIRIRNAFKPLTSTKT